MLTRLGFFVLLFPVALLQSLPAALIGAGLWLYSFAVRPKLNLLDLALGLLLLALGLSWTSAPDYGRSFIDTHVASYLVFLFTLRFLYACRAELLRFVVDLPLYGYLALCAFYLVVQLKVGYEYEVGTLEAFLLMRLVLDPRVRQPLLALLVAYLLLMYAVSTRGTPLVIALIVLTVQWLRPPRLLLRTAYLAVLLGTPLLGLLLSAELTDRLSVVDDNASIRFEMIKGASANLGLQQVLFGSGFGEPFRAPDYAYAFRHPLLNDPYWVHQVSNHNSLFDLFLRLGLPAYALFCLVFLGVWRLREGLPPAYYTLLFVVLFSLSINAYLDKTKLAPCIAVLVAGILFCVPRSAGERGVPRVGRWAVRGQRG